MCEPRGRIRTRLRKGSKEVAMRELRWRRRRGGRERKQLSEKGQALAPNLAVFFLPPLLPIPSLVPLQIQMQIPKSEKPRQLLASSGADFQGGGTSPSSSVSLRPKLKGEPVCTQDSLTCLLSPPTFLLDSDSRAPNPL